jgi:hypothetical protein
MGRRTPHSSSSINRNSEFHDKFGQLKDGYSYTGGSGMVARGMGNVSVRYGAGPDGTNYKVEQRTIFGKEANPAPAPAPAPQSAPPPPPPKPQPKKPEPVEHSPEIKQAKERVQKYQEDVSSGEVSNRIYGKSNTGFLDKYQMNLNQ